MASALHKVSAIERTDLVDVAPVEVVGKYPGHARRQVASVAGALLNTSMTSDGGGGPCSVSSADSPVPS